MEVVTFLQFLPIVKYWGKDECVKSYEDFAVEGWPPGAFEAEVLATGLGEGDEKQAVFAVNANFIRGGVFVVVSVHRSVVDGFGLAAIVRCMSDDICDVPPARRLSSLQADGEEQSRIRDRLSGSREVRASGHAEFNNNPDSALSNSSVSAPGNCRILTFGLDKILEATELVNQRSELVLDQPFVRVRPIECLIAILWKSLTRVRRLRTESEHQSTLKVEVDMRKRIDPPLDNDYIGNACFLATAEAPALRLNLPMDVGTLRAISQTVRGMMAVPETRMRSAIAAINHVSDVRSIIRSPVLTDADVLITDWSGFPMERDATMGLGLGNPQAVRCVSGEQVRHGCVIMPPRKEAGAWEVEIRYDNETMGRLVEEGGGLPFLLRVA